MCASYLSAIGDNAQIVDIYYFTAIARHLLASDPDIEKRHTSYTDCLADTGVSVEFARFKKKKISCPHCRQTIVRHEEKETDVAIASKLLEVCHYDQCDTVIIVSGDTDIVPAVHTVRRMFPTKRIGFLLPYNRHNKELILLSPKTHFLIAKTTYPKFQFPDPYVAAGGKLTPKPPKW
jgi:NAD kinase